MSNEFGKDHGLIHEVVVTGRKFGAGEEFWAALAHREDIFAKVFALVTESLRVIFTLIAKIERDMTGWTCLEPVEAEEGDFEPVLQEFLKDGEIYCDGEDMVKCGRNHGALTGLRHAEAMLRNQERILVEWQKYCLVFTEVWRSPYGSRSVWYLYWHGERWYLHCHRLADDFSSDYRRVASRKYQKPLDT